MELWVLVFNPAKPTEDDPRPGVDSAFHSIWSSEWLAEKQRRKLGHGWVIRNVPLRTGEEEADE